jgi:hypothetical protein
MHRRRLPAGVPLPARAGVAWSGFPRTCRAVGFCAAVRSERVRAGGGHYRPPPVRSCPLVRVAPAPGVDVRASSRGRLVRSPDGITVTCCGDVLSRRRSWGFPIRPFAGFVPRPGVAVVSASRDARRLLASRVRRFRRDGPTCRSPRAPPRVVWLGGPADRCGRTPCGRRSERSARERSARSRGVGPASGLRSRARSASADVRLFRRARSCLGFLGPLSGVRAKQTCSTRSCRRTVMLALCRSRACTRLDASGVVPWRKDGSHGHARVRSARVSRHPLP